MKTPLRLLLVGDSEEEMAGVLEELRRHGYDPSFQRAHDATSLGAALNGPVWDVVISRYILKDFKGLDVLALLKSKTVLLRKVRDVLDGSPSRKVSASVAS